MIDRFRPYLRVELVAYLILAVSFSWILHSVDQNAIHRGDQAFAAAVKAGHQSCLRGQESVREINKTHRGIKHGYDLLAGIASDNITAINRATRLGLIPNNLKAYYEGVLARQQAIHEKWKTLSKSVPRLGALNCGAKGK